MFNHASVESYSSNHTVKVLEHLMIYLLPIFVFFFVDYIIFKNDLLAFILFSLFFSPPVLVLAVHMCTKSKHSHLIFDLPVKHENRLQVTLFSVFNSLSRLLGMGFLYLIMNKSYLLETNYNFLTVLILGLILWFLMDAGFTFSHYLMHKNKYLFKNYHSEHHTARVPEPVSYLNTHPVENTIINLFILVIITLFILLTESLGINISGKNFFYGMILAYLAVDYIALLSHSNYFFATEAQPEIISRHWYDYLLPFTWFNGLITHSLHHARFTENYQGYFCWFDKMMGTASKDIAAMEKRILAGHPLTKINQRLVKKQKN